jgi:SAM-dependent methyltransferase
MLDWTGERFVPWVDDPALAYEHLHRYVFACGFAEGKRVLDLGSGEGYGSALLARGARSVVGLDIDPQAVLHARKKYPDPNLDFVCASVSSLPFAGTFDLVVCFETLEHIEEHEALVGEARRVLAPDGLFVVSTPDKNAYSDEPHHDNPYHVRELYFDEFRDLLGKTFPEVRMLAQRVAAGSRIWPMGPDSVAASRHEHVIVHAVDGGLEPAPADAGDPIYFLAVAGARPTPATGSILVDASGTLLESHENTRKRLEDENRLTKEDKARALEWKESRIADLNVALEWRTAQVSNFERTEAEVKGYVQQLESEIGQKNAYIGTLEVQLRDQTRRAELAERPLAKKVLDWLRQRLRAGR